MIIDPETNVWTIACRLFLLPCILPINGYQMFMDYINKYFLRKSWYSVNRCLKCTRTSNNDHLHSMIAYQIDNILINSRCIRYDLAFSCTHNIEHDRKWIWNNFHHSLHIIDRMANMNNLHVFISIVCVCALEYIRFLSLIQYRFHLILRTKNLISISWQIFCEFSSKLLSEFESNVMEKCMQLEIL